MLCRPPLSHPIALGATLRERSSKLANPAVGNFASRMAEMAVLTGEKQAVSTSDHHSRAKASKSLGSAVFRRGERVGTAVAINRKGLGSAMPQRAPAMKRGRRSTALRRRDVENVLAAGDKTAKEHRGLNRFTTIHFDAAGLQDPVANIGRLMKLAGDWLRTKGETLTYIWVREAGHWKGDHVHILWHVPPRLIRSFAKRERGWRRLMGAKVKRGAFKTKRVGMSYAHCAHEIEFGASYRANLEHVLHYVCKGAPPVVAEAMGLVFCEDGGELWGKRCGISENLNRKARSASLK